MILILWSFHSQGAMEVLMEIFLLISSGSWSIVVLPSLYLAKPVKRSGIEQHGFSQCRLACPAVRHQAHVAELSAV